MVAQNNNLEFGTNNTRRNRAPSMSTINRIIRTSRPADNQTEDQRLSIEESVRAMDAQTEIDLQVVRDILNAMEAIDNRDNRRDYIQQAIRDNREFRNIVNSRRRLRLVEEQLGRNIPMLGTNNSYQPSPPLYTQDLLQELFTSIDYRGGRKRRSISRRTSIRRTRRHKRSIRRRTRRH